MVYEKGCFVFSDKEMAHMTSCQVLVERIIPDSLFKQMTHKDAYSKVDTSRVLLVRCGVPSYGISSKDKQGRLVLSDKERAYMSSCRVLVKRMDPVTL